jgi:hypothetical protein
MAITPGKEFRDGELKIAKIYTFKNKLIKLMKVQIQK